MEAERAADDAAAAGSNATPKGPDLTGADLAGRNLRQAELAHALMYGATLAGADLTGAQLRHADLRYANLTECNLASDPHRRADLTHARLRGAELIRANLEGADLSDADLNLANLTGGIFDHAIMRRASFFSANLSDARFVGTYMPQAYLAGANLADANFAGADLTGANLVGANLVGANLASTNLSFADLTRANLAGVDLTATKLTGVKATTAAYPVAILEISVDMEADADPESLAYILHAIATLCELVSSLYGFLPTSDTQTPDQIEIVTSRMTYGSPLVTWLIENWHYIAGTGGLGVAAHQVRRDVLKGKDSRLFNLSKLIGRKTERVAWNEVRDTANREEILRLTSAIAKHNADVAEHQARYVEAVLKIDAMTKSDATDSLFQQLEAIDVGTREEIRRAVEALTPLINRGIEIRALRLEPDAEQQ
ncbi:pentapeptide repeat-containing protein [Gordonia sp. LSe1-13]|uniref:Pentapeptide repeat-containing protein n=1 Tax=Gordonia sesuvii TaxID=3116777 RepID=A0ABU7MFX6_9ACTN|nr:pentapeptide repeat-containing protein [Gordonia sp. LSe1-13]